MKEKIIILGTAHGENVSGKCSPDKHFREYRYSRDIVRELKYALEHDGYKVFVDIEADTVPQQQSLELTLRTGIVNSICQKYGSSNCIYVSVHVNAAPPVDGKWHQARGWSIYTSVGKTKADRLATCIWDAANEILPHDHKHALRRDMTDGDVDFEANFWVLKHTVCPAVLTENLFMDNWDDVMYLTSDEGRAAIVELHRRGIERYLNENK